jgi:hypothetical protein
MKIKLKDIPKQKRKYSKPSLKKIKLDKEISLVMMSNPPDNPDGSVNPLSFTDNPFKFKQL